MHHLEQPMLPHAPPLTPLVSSVTRSRQLLRELAAQLPTLRADLAVGPGAIWGHGRSDIFMVPKRRSQPEIVAYGPMAHMTRALLARERHGTPIDPAVEHAIDPAVATCMQLRLPFPPEMRNTVDDIHSLDPSATYRWWEGKHHPAISLDTLADDPPSPFIPDGFSPHGFSHLPQQGWAHRRLLASHPSHTPRTHASLIPCLFRSKPPTALLQHRTTP
jgi:hypothetical protein